VRRSTPRRDATLSLSRRDVFVNTGSGLFGNAEELISGIYRIMLALPEREREREKSQSPNCAHAEIIATADRWRSYYRKQQEAISPVLLSDDLRRGSNNKDSI